MHLLLLAACERVDKDTVDTGDTDVTDTDTDTDTTDTDTTDTDTTDTDTTDTDTTDGTCALEAPPEEDGPSNADCAAELEVGTFDPVVEWEWASSATLGSYVQVMSTPAVGDVDGDGMPDIVFTAFTGTSWNSPGALVILDGAGGVVLETSSPGGQSIQGAGAPALGDLDGDGVPEICVPGETAAVVCVHADGALVWAAGTEVSHYGAPAIADLDNDGLAEVILGRQIFDATGVLVGLGTEGKGAQSAFWDGTDTALSFAADIDGDGTLEVIAGNAVYERDGTLVWSDGGEDGFPAAGNFDNDQFPEIVKVHGGLVSLLDDDGTELWTVDPGMGGLGGPPTVADFDGDGSAEIGVAGASLYVVIESDGYVLWSTPVQDLTSNMTGSAVFDFEGDGAAEVVYADEETLWVWDGATGDVELALADHASATAFEYPVIADVDADGSAEIVLASNNSYYAGWNGVRVIGDATSSWRAGRPVWNQHAWSLTNIDDDLSVPATRTENWLRYNNFRSGDLATGYGAAQPDLRMEFAEICELECEDGRLQVTVRISNVGAAPSGGVITAFDGATQLATFELPEVEEGREVSMVLDIPIPDPAPNFFLTLDPDEEPCRPTDELAPKWMVCD